MAIRFPEGDVRPFGRDTMGVQGIRLCRGDEVVSMISAHENICLVTVTENGLSKRTSLDDFRRQKQGGKGPDCP